MKKIVSRCVALAAILGIGLALIWLGFSTTTSRGASSESTKPITARERMAALHPGIHSSAGFVNNFRGGNRPSARMDSIQRASRPFPFPANEPWRMHPGAVVNPVPVALPEGTVMARGLPARRAIWFYLLPFLSVLVLALATAAYAAWGGLKTVAATDVLLSAIMVTGMVVLWVVMWQKIGGWEGMERLLHECLP